MQGWPEEVADKFERPGSGGHGRDQAKAKEGEAFASRMLGHEFLCLNDDCVFSINKSPDSPHNYSISILQAFGSEREIG